MKYFYKEINRMASYTINKNNDINYFGLINTTVKISHELHFKEMYFFYKCAINFCISKLLNGKIIFFSNCNLNCRRVTVLHIIV